MALFEQQGLVDYKVCGGGVRMMGMCFGCVYDAHANGLHISVCSHTVHHTHEHHMHTCTHSQVHM